MHTTKVRKTLALRKETMSPPVFEGFRIIAPRRYFSCQYTAVRDDVRKV
jgi:hypothetical protein